MTAARLSRLAAVCMLAACTRSAPTTDPAAQPTAPLLAGETVLLLPVQRGGWPAAGTAQAHLDSAALAALDAELAFWLGERGGGVRWVGPATIRRELARSPVVDVRPHDLDVASFRHAQVRRVGDPLFGDLRRLAAMLDAGYALVPVGAAFAADSAAGGARVHVAAALIDASTGFVLWFGAAAGTPAAAPDAAALASAAQQLARAVVPNAND